MKYLRQIVGCCMVAGLMLTTAVANAALLSFEDDDIDFHLRLIDSTDDEEDNPTLQVVSGAFATGDVLMAVFEIGVFTTDGVNSIPTGQELTGVSAIQIVNDPATGSLVFAPYAGGLNEVLALGTSGATVADGDAGEGAMIAMWFNGAPGVDGDTNLDVNRSTLDPAGITNCASIGDCLTQASLGELFQVDGFAGDPDEFWVSFPALQGAFDSSIVAGLANDRLVATFNAGLSNFYHNGPDVVWQDALNGSPCGDAGAVADGCIQLFVSGTITGGLPMTNGAFAHSDFDGTKLTVPAPGALSLLGLGLVGLGFFSRKKQHAAA